MLIRGASWVHWLDGFRLKWAVATLRDIEQEIKEKQKWMALLMSFKGNPIDARDLLETSNKINRESINLEHTVAALAAEAKRGTCKIPPTARLRL